METKIEEVLFITKKPEYVVVVEAEYQKEVMGRPMTIPGKRITFSLDGEYRTSDPKEIELIRGKKYFGTDVWEIDQVEQKEIQEMEQKIGLVQLNNITTAVECPYCTRSFVTQHKLEQHVIGCSKRKVGE